ncbi:MAG: chemotaxis protein CheA [Pseudomonadota bacterium]
MSTSEDPMAEIKASFFVECEELLENLAESLQIIDDGQDDEETINVVFRAVHSIKGGAGAFGLDDLVEFSHSYETVLDQVRSGDLKTDKNALRLFFAAADMLSDITRASRDGTEFDRTRSQSILKELGELIGAEESNEEEEGSAAASFAPLTLRLDLPGLSEDAASDGQDAQVSEDKDPNDQEDTDGRHHYRIFFRPHHSLYAANNEPQFILRCLQKLGPTKIKADIDAVVPLDVRPPDSASIAWNIDLETDADLAEVQEIFEFVADLCDLEIEEIGAAQSDVARAPAPEEDMADLAPIDASAPMTTQAIEAGGTRDQNARTGGEEQVTTRIAKTVPAVPEGPAANPATSKPAQVQAAKPTETAGPKATVRVDLEKIDRLVNLVGELVINQAMLSQSAEQAGIPANSAVMQGLEEFMQLTRDIQESVMMIRAQPVKSLFQRMARIAREASAAIEKDVRLKTFGDTTEVDKTVIERLADPLTHMIRNAVDHGLETKEGRAEAGKPPTGIVSLTAAHRSGRVIIEITDDGAGIDRERVLARAVERGLVPASATLSDSEIDNLLFMPGFSTAEAVSSLSGRGVGMDVVKTAIQSLGGNITITSEKGRGSTFSISLPLTLAVLDGMVVQVAGETLVIPLNAIVETLTLSEDNLRSLGAQGFVVEIRGGFAPLIDLGVELGYRQVQRDYAGSIVLVIGLDDGRRSTLVVDAIQDQRQVVIKGLQQGFGDIPGIAAATILGDGQIALILDPVGLTRRHHAASVLENSLDRKVG